MEIQKSFYVIKPHGLKMRDEVRSMIEGSGLTIVESKQLVLPEWALHIIYCDLAEKWRIPVFRQFRNQLVEAGVVSGPDAITTLLQVAGTELDPVDCAPGSIRFRFGEREPYLVDGVRCYANIIHRSRNKEEAEKDIRVFLTLQS